MGPARQWHGREHISTDAGRDGPPASENETARGGEESVLWEPSVRARPREQDGPRGSKGKMGRKGHSGPIRVLVLFFILFCFIFFSSSFHFQISNLNVDLVMNLTLVQMFDFVSLV
jgi:hypothetical protein